MATLYSGREKHRRPGLSGMAPHDQKSCPQNMFQLAPWNKALAAIHGEGGYVARRTEGLGQVQEIVPFGVPLGASNLVKVSIQLQRLTLVRSDPCAGAFRWYLRMGT